MNDAIWTSCPKCSALPGDGCMGSRRPLKPGKLHAARVKAARRDERGPDTVSSDAQTNEGADEP